MFNEEVVKRNELLEKAKGANTDQIEDLTEKTMNAETKATNYEKIIFE